MWQSDIKMSNKKIPDVRFTPTFQCGWDETALATWSMSFYPKSVIRLHTYFVLPSDGLFSGFVEDVAGYIEINRGTRRRRQCGIRMKSRQSSINVLISVLMTDLGLYRWSTPSVCCRYVVFPISFQCHNVRICHIDVRYVWTWPCRNLRTTV